MISFGTQKWDTTQSHQNNYYNYIYKELSPRVDKFYIKIIDKISEQNKDEINWWLSSAATKNTFNSDLFHIILLKKVILRLDKEKKLPNVIQVKNLNIKNYLEKWIVFKVSKKISITTNSLFMEKIKNFFHLGYVFFYYLLIFFFFKNLKKTNLKNSPLNLIEVYFNLDNKNFEFYYGKDFCHKLYNDKNSYFVPNFLPNGLIYLFNRKIFKSIIADSNLLLKETYLSLGIYFKIIFKIIFQRKIKSNSKLISRIINNEINSFNDFTSTFIGYLNYYFFQSLKKNRIKINKSINWYENQPCGKGWCLGSNQFYNNISVGYQGFTYFPEMLHSLPSNFEYDSKVLPNLIALNGKFYEDVFKEYCQKDIYHVGPALRYQYLHKVNIENNKYKKNLTAILSGIPLYDYKVLSLLNNSSNRFGYKFFIKPHPILNKLSKNDIPNNKNLIYIDDEITEIYENSRLIICTGPTSALLESIALGLNLIVPKITNYEHKLISKIPSINNNIILTNNIDDMHKAIISLNENAKRVNNLNYFFNKTHFDSLKIFF